MAQGREATGIRTSDLAKGPGFEVNEMGNVTESLLASIEGT